ncbi:Rpp14/Pop5 family protein [Thermogladius sp. 4427co]|uniref:Rpp14/Pop5 family protein n=1 Tax=Thermogladius sp. 4427co TaxID=3450718 RepID=UPI003F7B07D5
MDLSLALSLISLVLSLATLALVALYITATSVTRKYLRRVFARKIIRKYRKRYLSLLYYPRTSINSPKELEDIVREGVRKYFGIIYLAKIDPEVVFFDPGESKAIIRFNGVYKLELLASLVWASSRGLKLVPVGVSGTFKSAKKKLG